VLENKSREIIADMLDNIISGNQYKALDKVSDILKNKTTDHIEELKKDFSSKLFNNKNMKS
jgi:hypothetical protein|tara:strand:- start:5121 stop:5303 length:183 start_codon:yes stop_codon:yes gene_type:complete